MLVPLSSVTLDEELQPRAAIDRTVLENYVQLLVDGVRFPPVVVFRDRGPIADVLWLADGFHRWHAHKVIQADSIDVTIHEGERCQALLYSLSANAKHGLQRGAIDYTRGYQIACRNGLLPDVADSDAVQALLQCSGSWADKLTAGAREAARVARDAEIIRLKDEGLSNRAVAREVGLSDVGVGKILSANRERSADSSHPMDYEDPMPPPAWVQKLRDLDSPEARVWSSALAALRLVNEQVSVDELYGLRFVGFDHVVSVELAKAYHWINELHGRFVNERDQRRRA